MNKYHIQYKNIWNDEIGAKIIKRPDISIPELRMEKITVEGRDGSLYRNQETYDDIERKYEFNFIVPAEKFIEKVRMIKKWLRYEDDSRLIESDNKGFCYLVKNVVVGKITRTKKVKGNFEVTFTIDPYEYWIEGFKEKKYTEVVNNDFGLSKPIYRIVGDGTCELLVNGKKVEIDVEGEVTIETELELCFNSFSEWRNTAMTGSYSDLYLNEGKNEIKISEGFELFITPRWRI